MLNRKTVLITLALVIVAIGQLFAQSKPIDNKKNTSQQISPDKPEQKANILLLPDFFQYGLVNKGDTAFAYEYYDKKMRIVNTYDLNDIDKIDHVKYFEKLNKYPNAKNGMISAPIIYVLKYEFGHSDPGSWERYDPHTAEMTRYSIHKNIIVGADTVNVTNPITKDQHKLIYKYCKTEIISTGTGDAHKH